MQVFEKSHAGFVDGFTEGDDKHEFALMVIAQDERAYLSLMGMLIIEGESVGTGILAYAIPDAIIDVRHEMTLVDIQHFVETVGDMKTESVRVVHMVQSSCRFDDFPGEPFTVSAGEFEFITVLVDMLGTKDRGDRRQVDLTDTGEVIDYLLLLVTELLFVRQDLPFAPTADTEMLASRFATHGAGHHETQHFGLHERVFLLRDLQVHDIARYTVGHKSDDIVDTHEGLAFCGNTGYLNVLKYR